MMAKMMYWDMAILSRNGARLLAAAAQPNRCTCVWGSKPDHGKYALFTRAARDDGSAAADSAIVGGMAMGVAGCLVLRFCRAQGRLTPPRHSVALD